MDWIILLAYAVVLVVISSSTTYWAIQAVVRKKGGDIASINQQIAASESRLAEIKGEIKATNTRFDQEHRQLVESLANARIKFEQEYKQAAGKVADANVQLRNKFAEIKLSYQELLKKDQIIKAHTVEQKRAEALIAEKRSGLASLEERTAHLVRLEANADQMREALEQDKRRRDEFQGNIKELSGRLQELKSELDLYSRIEDFVSYGLFDDPEYLHNTPDRYQAEIKRVREKQKELVSGMRAVNLATGIEIGGSSKTGDAVLAGQSRLMLRAFNIECDFLMEKLNPANFDRTLERIDSIAEGLEKTTASLATGISTPYMKLKYEECRLLYEYKLKKAAQEEEQRLIREQIREEQRAVMEYEKAIADAEREERIFKGLLDKMQEQLRGARDDERGEMERQIQTLEAQLKEAQEKEQRAKSMAEQTRKGHIYIISNIGSFGEQVYKIGLTRRLEPMERVKELGDASVPFLFDVHAIVYSDDAPAMEAALHKQFDHSRVNAVNRKKEFFRVPLSEIKNAVERMAGREADFIMTAAAEEYYETMRLQGGRN